MAIVRFKGKLTEHFTLEEYTKNQTETCYLTREAFEHFQMLEEFRLWYGKPLTVSAAYRTPKYNASVGGVKNSNHLNGCAVDLTMKIDHTEFIRLAKRWKMICEKYNTVGEAGWYAGGWIHLGSHITYSKTFYNWRTDINGKQTNMYFKI